MTIRDKVCIVGIGETEYTRHGKIGRSEFRLALEAILAACADAGIDPAELDGFASYSNDRNDPIRISTALGCRDVTFSNMFWGGGGGGGSGAVANAAAAIHAGYSRYVVAYRSLAQGQFQRFGQAAPVRQVGGAAAFSVPFGMMTPAQMLAMQTRRHMHDYGTTREQMGAVALASYKHAQHNPRAVMYGRPLTMEQYLNARVIADPFHLYDCCLETDGAAAVILASAERARDMRRKPVYIMGAAQGSGPRQGAGAHNKPNYTTANFGEVAKRLYAMAGVGPDDIDVAQIYENFTGMVIMSIEDHLLCKRGEGGPFVEGGRIEHPAVADPGAPHAGKLPINTSGGNLAEAYTHGFELVTEAVRQLRGEATLQVQDAHICLVASGPGVAPVSDMILRN